LDSFTSQVLPSLVTELCLLPPLHNSLITAIRYQHATCLEHANPDLQAICASIIPDGLLASPDPDARVAAVTAWFQQEYFTFVRVPPCRICHTNDQMGDRELIPPTVSDLAGKAPKVEGYRCKKCGGLTRFPRYNRVENLIETRFGRCGEFANVFAAFLAACDLDVRLVWDFADHIWVDYWSESKGYYVHVDPCENKIDQPLLYEQGWGKDYKLVVAVSGTQVEDVTKRYVKDYRAVLGKRAEALDEEWVARYIRFQGEVFAAGLGEAERAQIADRQRRDREAMERGRGEIVPGEQEGRLSGKV
jgi:peptide-N4-(N-acetyl-beta-glucosaminyl)asparagine amidase